MSRRSNLFLVVVLLLVPSGFAMAQENLKGPQQFPKPVVSAFQRAFPNATQASYREEVLEGNSIFEIEFFDNGKSRAAYYSEEGKLLMTDEEIGATQLPAAIITSIKQSYLGALLKRAEIIADPQGVTIGYEVDITQGNKAIELRIDTGGAIVFSDEVNQYPSRIGLSKDQKSIRK